MPGVDFGPVADFVRMPLDPPGERPAAAQLERQPGGGGSGPVVQRRGYGNLEVDAFIQQNPQNDDETYSQYLARVTNAFKDGMQYWQRDDLKYLRKQLGGHRSLLLKGYPDNGKTLDPGFDAHIQGNHAGAGWHTESVHADGDHGYAYVNQTSIAASKGTYAADNAVVAGVAKAGNNGRSTFYPDDMAMQEIRAEATYVANVHAGAQQGQLIVGRGKKTGIMIECLMNGNVITSAYPYE